MLCVVGIFSCCVCDMISVCFTERLVGFVQNESFCAFVCCMFCL